MSPVTPASGQHTQGRFKGNFGMNFEREFAGRFEGNCERNFEGNCGGDCEQHFEGYFGVSFEGNWKGRLKAILNGRRRGATGGNAGGQQPDPLTTNFRFVKDLVRKGNGRQRLGANTRIQIPNVR